MTQRSKIPLLTTGLSGLVGSKFEQTYSNKYSFEKLDISNPENPIDITQISQVEKAITSSKARALIHLAAFTDVTSAWQQQGDKNGLAYQVNVRGTKNIVDICQKLDIQLIHISTAFVFDGQKEGLYTEQDPPNPIEWYGQTKARAEEMVLNSSGPWTILRIDFPFRSDHYPKPDIVRKTLATIKKGIPLFSNHFFGPTYIDDLAKVFDWFVATRTKGLFNASNGEKWSDYQLGQELVKSQNLNLEVKEGDLADYLKKLDRPYQKNTAMDNSKLTKVLDFELTPISEALEQVEL